MKKLYIDRVLSALAVIIWLGVIFSFSAQSSASSVSVSTGVTEKIARFFTANFDSLSPERQAEIVESLHHFVRKAAHFSEYALLGILTANALRTYRLRSFLRFALPTVLCFVFAVSDEIHQYFVPDRACRAFDVLLDTLGAVTGICLFLLAIKLIQRLKRRKRLYDKEN